MTNPKLRWDLECCDALEGLRNLPDESVSCCVTSPPYFGLRNYKVDGQVGLELTIAEYVEHLRAIFADVRRVLQSDGTFWLVLGDSYAGSGKGQMGDGSHSREYGTKQGTNTGTLIGGLPKSHELPAKNLMLIPSRVALALQDDGWILRNDVIWQKPNPYPGSQRDRFTCSYEHVFFFVKSKRYYFDMTPIRELSVSKHPSGNGYKRPERLVALDKNGPRGSDTLWTPTEYRTPRDVWTMNTEPTKNAHFATFPTKLVEKCILAGCQPDGVVLDPFVGSGTTLVVAAQLGRRSIGFDLNPDYIEMARARIESLC